ncbi:hypothetical protein ACFO3D_09270 [Virgibacillus kekensis]|uniref:t-SNARE coiled-coil homology domain-containing protein n=1 Tax=Virgibacillus kekensis TaxID=202261 RepID=A0ABV9DI32_9BACI
MGLFINDNDHPDVYGNSGDIAEPNQEYFKYDYFGEMIEEQKKINRELANSFREMKSLNVQHNLTQSKNWKDVRDQLNELKVSNIEHAEFERQAMEWLATLDRNNRKLQGILEHGDTMKQGIIEQVKNLEQSNAKITDQLANYETTSQDLAMKINELTEASKEMSEQISRQGDNQDNVMNRLENQEALMEKTLRQIDHFRSILFERTNHIAEKIESSYDMTSSYVYKLITGSEQPVSMYMKEREKVENKKD